MKNVIILIALLLLGKAVFTMPIQGVVKAGKEKLAGVLVTDGYQFVRTDADGKFEMDTDAKAGFVYLVTPDGYVSPYESGTPLFWQPLRQQQKEYPFNLIPTGKSENCVLIAIADVQTRNDKQFERYRAESISDLKATIASYPKNTRVVGISLGDIVWDHFEHFPVYKKEMAALGIPFYPVIGNHDHDKALLSDAASAHAYEKHFGPANYAFQYGNSYIIVLDNILYWGNKKYEEALTDEQIEWVKALLKFIPKGSQIVVATHSPFHLRNKGNIPGTDKLLAALKGYKTDLISGHTHLNSHHEIAPGVIEHNTGAICGTWWTADENRDGTPNGYSVFEMSSGQLQWYYKSTGHDRNRQFKVFPENTVKERPDAILAKVWNWDPQWSVKWYEDGVLKGEMERADCYDPDYLKYVEKAGLKKYTQPEKSFFYFFATPSAKARKIEVEVTDRFGHTFPRQSITKESVTTYQNKDFHEIYQPVFKNDGAKKKVKNIIFMIGDGLGLTQLSSGMYANRNSLNITKLKNIGLIKTFSLSDFITDSAASGTAYATGKKTKNGCIGTDSSGNKHKNITEILSARHYATGIVTTDQISGATPAVFYAHQLNRNMTPEILTDLVSSKLLFAAGGSLELYRQNGEEKMTALEKQDFTVIHDYKQLPEAGRTAHKIALIAHDTDVKSIRDGRPEDYLTTTTREAIAFLSQRSDKGFFLMVEGAQIDFGGHVNDMGYVVSEVLDFDKAVAEALKFADEDGETLVVITADHETGGLAIRDGNPAESTIEGIFTSGGHTPVLVPVYAYGPQSFLFRGVQDNTEIFPKFLQLLNIKE